MYLCVGMMATVGIWFISSHSLLVRLDKNDIVVRLIFMWISLRWILNVFLKHLQISTDIV